jgi:hypothetical protein
MTFRRLIEILTLFGAGMIHSCCIHRVITLLIFSIKLRYYVVQTILLNGIIFLSSSIFVDYFLDYFLIVEEVDPLLHKINWYSSFLISYFIYLLWIYPIYCISMILCSFWNKDIAVETYLFTTSTKKNSINNTLTQICQGVAEDIYNLLVIGTYLIQIMLFSKIPYIGTFLATIQLAWFYAFTSFDYKWSLEGIPLFSKIYICENNWAYMAGFGIIPALLTVGCTRYVGASILALLTPIFIITAMTSTINKGINTNYFPIFKGVTLFNSLLIKMVTLCCKRK